MHSPNNKTKKTHQVAQPRDRDDAVRELFLLVRWVGDEVVLEHRERARQGRGLLRGGEQRPE